MSIIRRHPLVRHVLLPLFVLLLCLADAQLAQGTQVDGFKASWAEAKKAAEESGKPIYLHFTTDWCGWCRRIENEIYKSEQGGAALADFVPASLDCTVPEGVAPSENVVFNQAMMNRLGGEGYPFLAMTTPEGAVLHTFSGYKPVDAFVDELNKAEAAFQEWREFQQYASQADRDSLEYNTRAVAMYAKVQLWDNAQAAAKKVLSMEQRGESVSGNDLAMAYWAVLAGQLHGGQNVDVSSVYRQVQQIRSLQGEGVEDLAGRLNEALFQKASSVLMGVRRVPDVAARQAMLDHAQAYLEMVDPSSEDPRQMQMIWAVLGQFNALSQRPERGLEAFRKALEVDESSEVAPKIRQTIAKLEETIAGQG